jgi:enoyl-CoA hydratase/carnithine racemase
MSKTMAEEEDLVAFQLYKNDHWGQPEAWPEGPFADDATLDDFKVDYLITTRRLLDALSAAGFGLVADAKAEALEEAADHLARLEYVRPDHPNRAAYENVLAVRRGNTDAWLKARARLIRADQ